MKIESQRNHLRDSTQFFIDISRNEIMTRAMGEALLRNIADEVAKRYVAEHYQEIVALIDPVAVANLSVAEGAAAIRKALHEKLPDKVLEIHRDSNPYGALAILAAAAAAKK